VRLTTDRVTVRELIRVTVEEQIRAYRARAADWRRMLDRQYLSDVEIRKQASDGVIRMPTESAGTPDMTAEVARAHRAFERGTFVLFVGGRQVGAPDQGGLDEEVVLRVDQPVVFLRLVALAGG
jgi:hypothetical protein